MPGFFAALAALIAATAGIVIYRRKPAHHSSKKLLPFNGSSFLLFFYFSIRGISADAFHTLHAGAMGGIPLRNGHNLTVSGFHTEAEVSPFVLIYLDFRVCQRLSLGRQIFNLPGASNFPEGFHSLYASRMAVINL